METCCCVGDQTHNECKSHDVGQTKLYDKLLLSVACDFVPFSDIDSFYFLDLMRLFDYHY